jgi:hypothetical protein
MNTQTTTLDNSSVDATTPDRVLHAFLDAWWRGNVVEAADQFSDRLGWVGLEAAHAGAVPDARKDRLTARKFRQETGRRPYHSP